MMELGINSPARRTGRFGRILIMAAAVILCLYSLWPYISALLTALTPLEKLYLTNQPWRVPIPPTLRNFIDMWSQIPLARYLFNTILLCLASVIVTMIAATTAAYALARMRFVGRTLYRYLILMTQMLSPVVLLIPLYKLMVSLGLFNTLWGVALMDAAITLPTVIWLQYGYFLSIPQDLIDAAALDGCNLIQTIAQVVLPISRPGLVTSTAFAFIAVWNEFLFAYTFLREPATKVLAVGVFDFIAQWTTYWNYLMAAILFATLPVIVVFIFLERQIVAGLIEGAVK
jgi:multiple sugar transport system permease protein